MEQTVVEKRITQLSKLKLHEVINVPMSSSDTAQRYRHAINRLKATEGKEFAQKSTGENQTLIVRTK